MQTPRKLFGGLGNQMFQMAYLYGQVRDGKIPDIYVQDYKLWEPYAEEIRNWYGKDTVQSDYVSLHVRRGDYVNNSFYVDLTQTDYYDKAIAEFPNEKFLVFCKDRQDDLVDAQDKIWIHNWARSKNLNYEIYYLENGTEVDDLNAMAGCKAHIAANSSFSWWASFISGNRTVVPHRWFSDGTSISLPEEWKQL